MTAIPVVDLEPFLLDRDSAAARATVERIRTACETVGFVAISGHGVDPARIATMCRATRTFFERPLAEKLQWDVADTGYRPSESGSLARTTGSDAAPGDLCETFRHRLSTQAGDRAVSFPSEPPAMREIWESWFATMERLCAVIMTVFARALSLPDDWFVPYFAPHSSVLIANYYPVPTSPPRAGQLRRGAHTDFGVLTVLYQSADDGGLEVRVPDSGEWVHVPFEPETFVLNLGDLMERWTNGRWVSTMHRVVNPAPALGGPGEPRISLPFFHRPDPKATISVITTCCGSNEAPRFTPVNAGEWMAAKQRLIYTA